MAMRSSRAVGVRHGGSPGNSTRWREWRVSRNRGREGDWIEGAGGCVIGGMRGQEMCPASLQCVQCCVGVSHVECSRELAEGHHKVAWKRSCETRGSHCGRRWDKLVLFEGFGQAALQSEEKREQLFLKPVKRVECEKGTHVSIITSLHERRKHKQQLAARAADGGSLGVGREMDVEIAGELAVDGKLLENRMNTKQQLFVLERRKFVGFTKLFQKLKGLDDMREKRERASIGSATRRKHRHCDIAESTACVALVGWIWSVCFEIGVGELMPALYFGQRCPSLAEMESAPQQKLWRLHFDSIN
eukprot:m.154864 g.154864  ORF g.154864 m.154864 type:complete len:303 (-) comp15138_c10_seq3:1563-2471(-)